MWHSLLLPPIPRHERCVQGQGLCQGKITCYKLNDEQVLFNSKEDKKYCELTQRFTKLTERYNRVQFTMTTFNKGAL